MIVKDTWSVVLRREKNKKFFLKLQIVTALPAETTSRFKGMTDEILEINDGETTITAPPGYYFEYLKHLPDPKEDEDNDSDDEDEDPLIELKERIADLERLVKAKKRR